MASEVTRQEAQVWLDEYFRARPDLGLRKATLAVVLEPPGLFEPKKSRHPKKSLVLLAVWFLGLLAVFACFNLLS
jgi:hypothetical protein